MLQVQPTQLLALVPEQKHAEPFRELLQLLSVNVGRTSLTRPPSLYSPPPTTVAEHWSKTQCLQAKVPT